MAAPKPALTLGIEEEYLLVDATTRDLARRAPPGFMQRCEAAIGPRVTHELLQSQVEVGTSVCATVDQASAPLASGRVREAALPTTMVTAARRIATATAASART